MENMPHVWRVLLAIAALALAVVVTHYVFHRPVWPNLLMILTIVAVGAVLGRAGPRSGGNEQRKPPRRNI
jgi:hypothetical protein